MKILSVYGSLPSTVSLIIDNKVISSVNEERFTRKKNDSIFPRNAINYCLKNSNIKVHNDFNSLRIIFKNKKIDYAMNAISGFEGLIPTLNIIKFSKTVAIANKESIICGWHLIKKNLDKYKTKFIPVDSEHFSIWSLIKDVNYKSLEKIYITAHNSRF